MSQPQLNYSYTTKSEKTREVIIATIAAAAVFGFVIYGVLSMSNKVGKAGMHGIITDKQFLPIQNTAIAADTKGSSKPERDGEYRFTVHINTQDRNYYAWVDKPTYNQFNIGDRYFFISPPDKPVEEEKSDEEENTDE